MVPIKKLSVALGYHPEKAGVKVTKSTLLAHLNESILREKELL